MAGSEPLSFTPLDSWLPLYQNLLIVAGPCSVENLHQLKTTAKELAMLKQVPVLRAGVWKPRSRPGNFEGVGEEALPWLQEIKKETGQRIAVEVAQPRHAELCLKHDVDILWLGARTSVNPFMVAEIARAIKGTGIAMMIKNPVSPDLQLWIGSIERIFQAGSNKIIAIHRGFHGYHKSRYRNIPLWSIPLTLKKELPGIPVICDPSHIAGDRRWIKEIAQKAMALRMDGLMIESHHKPEHALTDPIQQITPAELQTLLKQVIPAEKKDQTEKQLAELRALIDDKDHELLELLAERLQMVEEIGIIKKDNKISILQPERKNDISTDRKEKGTALGLKTEFVDKLFSILHQESVNIQQSIQKKEKNRPIDH